MHQQMNMFQKPIMPCIYDNINSIMQAYMAQHSKMFIVRADIRYPQDYPFVPDNFHIQRCMAKTIQYFRRNGYNPMYIWVREQKTAFHHGQLIMRSRGIPENVYGMMDYLAKDDGKGEPNDGLRDFGMSRLNNRTMINPHQQEEK